jgi:acetylglutamate kinase
MMLRRLRLVDLFEEFVLIRILNHGGRESSLHRQNHALVSGSLLLKFGGSVAGGSASDPVLRDLVVLAERGMSVAVVHGGGPAVDKALHNAEMITRRIAGLRVTDAETLEVVVDVLGRRVNASIVAALLAARGRPARVGGDEGVFWARKLEIPQGDLGFVGEIERVDATNVYAVMERGSIPVVSPIGIDASGQRWNINADTAAGALAAALVVDTYVVVTDVDRVRVVRDDPSTGIERMTLAQAEGYRMEGVFTDGMIPKIDAALDAVRGGVPRAIICGPGEGALQAALLGAGTEIVA